MRITGRKKEILVTAGGKNVAPAVLEDRVRAHALVDQCLVVGDGQPFIGALVTLDREALTVWAEARGLSGSAEDLLDHADVRAAVEEAVEDAKGLIEAFETAGSGVATYKNKMIENLHVESARRTLTIHEAISALG